MWYETAVKQSRSLQNLRVLSIVYSVNKLTRMNPAPDLAWDKYIITTYIELTKAGCILQICIGVAFSLGSLSLLCLDDVIKWKYFPRNWPLVRGIQRLPVNSPHKDQWRRALMFSLIYAWISGWVNNCEVGDLGRHRAHYYVIVMWCTKLDEKILFMLGLPVQKVCFHFRSCEILLRLLVPQMKVLTNMLDLNVRNGVYEMN